MPFPTNPFLAGLTMKFTKIRLFYHARYAVTRNIRGLTSNAMIIIVREIIKIINIKYGGWFCEKRSSNGLFFFLILE